MLRLAILGVSKTRWTGARKVHLTTREMVFYFGLAGHNEPQVYAPMNNAEKQVKKDFYHQLQTAFNKRKARDLPWLSVT